MRSSRNEHDANRHLAASKATPAITHYPKRRQPITLWSAIKAMGFIALGIILANIIF